MFSLWDTLSIFCNKQSKSFLCFISIRLENVAPQKLSASGTGLVERQSESESIFQITSQCFGWIFACLSNRQESWIGECVQGIIATREMFISISVSGSSKKIFCPIQVEWSPLQFKSVFDSWWRKRISIIKCFYSMGCLDINFFFFCLYAYKPLENFMIMFQWKQPAL